MLAYLQFLSEQVFCVVNRIAQDCIHRQEGRLVVGYDTTVGRKIDFAIAECIERIYGLVARNPWRQVQAYLYLRGSHVFYLLNFQLPFFYRLGNAVLKRRCRFRKRNLTYDKCLGIEFLYLGAYL